MSNGVQGYLTLEKTAFNELGEEYERQQEAAKRALRTRLSRRSGRRHRSSRRKLSSVSSASGLDDLDRELNELDGVVIGRGQQRRPSNATQLRLNQRRRSDASDATVRAQLSKQGTQLRLNQRRRSLL